MKSLLIVCCLATAAFAAPRFKPQFKRGLNKIVGGEDATPGEIPWQVSFQDLNFGGFHFCGGSVYNENWVITAAHCVQGEDFENPDYLQIVAGEHDMDVDEGNEQAIVLQRIIQHEAYNALTVENDISVLQLSSPLTLNEFVQPIALPAQLQASSGDSMITGWGDTTEGGTAATVLQKVIIPIVTDEECNVSYGGEVYESMICAGVPEGGVDSCQGDSGGPMVCDLTGSQYLCGIVSWGYGCARPDYPGVYTEVSYFVDWVLANTAA